MVVYKKISLFQKVTIVGWLIVSFSSSCQQKYPHTQNRYGKLSSWLATMLRTVSVAYHADVSPTNNQSRTVGKSTVFEPLFVQAQQFVGVPIDRRLPVYAMDDKQQQEFGYAYAYANDSAIMIDEQALFEVAYGVTRLVALHEAFHLARADHKVQALLDSDAWYYGFLFISALTFLSISGRLILKKPKIALCWAVLLAPVVTYTAKWQQQYLTQWYKEYSEYSADTHAFAALSCQDCVQENLDVLESQSACTEYLQPHEIEQYLTIQKGKRCAYHTWLASVVESSSSTSNLNS